MPNEEFTQKNEALPEKELDGISGGFFAISLKGEIGTEGITCPVCGDNDIMHFYAEGYRYKCRTCGYPFGQDQGSTRMIIR